MVIIKDIRPLDLIMTKPIKTNSFNHSEITSSSHETVLLLL